MSENFQTLFKVKPLEKLYPNLSAASFGISLSAKGYFL